MIGVRPPQNMLLSIFFKKYSKYTTNLYHLDIPASLAADSSIDFHF